MNPRRSDRRTGLRIPAFVLSLPEALQAAALEIAPLLALCLASGVLVHAATAQAQAPTLGLVAHYPLDGDATDLSGNAIHGVLHGSPSFVQGVFADAIQLDGASQYVSIPPTIAGALDVFTISVWARIDDVPASQAYIAVHDRQNGDTAPNKHFDFRIDATQLYSGWEASDGDNRSISDPDFVEYAAEEWVHLALTRDGSGVGELWVDGFMMGTTQGSIETTNPDDILIGAIREMAGESAPGAFFFEGRVDELRIYDRVLSTSEIIALREPSLAAPAFATLAMWSACRARRGGRRD